MARRVLALQAKMAVKATKSEAELIGLLMAELRKHPQCDHVVSVAIVRPRGQNWDAVWSVRQNYAVCPRAYKIARAFQARFDLA